MGSDHHSEFKPLGRNERKDAKWLEARFGHWASLPPLSPTTVWLLSLWRDRRLRDADWRCAPLQSSSLRAFLEALPLDALNIDRGARMDGDVEEGWALLTLASAIRGNFRFGHSARTFDRVRDSMASQVVSVLAVELARTEQRDRSLTDLRTVAACGLMYNLGLGIVAYASPAEFGAIAAMGKTHEMAFDDAFQAHTGFPLSSVALRAGQVWGLPRPFLELYEVATGATSLPSSDPRNCVGYAYEVAKRHGYCFANWSFLPTGEYQAPSPWAVGQTLEKALMDRTSDLLHLEDVA